MPVKGKGGRETIGPFTYRWDEGCFPVTADSLALGEFVTLKPGDRALDLGCGAGLLLLKCAARERDLTLYGVEAAAAAAALARENLEENSLEGEIVTGDVLGPLPGGMDVVVSNPPWYPPNTGAFAGPAKTESATLSDWIAAGGRALVPGGRFALAHRSDRLVDLLCALRGAGLEPKRLRLLQHTADAPASTALVEAVKGGRPGLSLLPTALLREEA